MALTQVRLAELKAQAEVLRQYARQLEAERAKLDEFGPGTVGDKHFLLGERIRQLYETARLIEEPGEPV